VKLLLPLAALALIWSASAAGSSTPLPAPTGVHAFVYRADEAVKADHTYALMPAFAWNAEKGARNYDLQLATSKTFSDATTIYRAEYNTPVASLQKTVPWMTGHPYALWVRVRVHAGTRTSGWSEPFGFNTAWQAVPQQEPAPEGLIRWTPVEGATGYQVWFLHVPGNYSLSFPTLTNVVDEREFWTFHPQLAGTIFWRVRAIRTVTDAALPNGIQAVTHGPYSPIYKTVVSGHQSTGTVQPVMAVSNTTSTPASVHAHQLTPGFAWTGDTDVLGDRSNYGLWRVYVFSDRQCVNPVLTGSIVGGDSWAPRNGDPLLLPNDTDALALAQGNTFPGWGTQGKVFTADSDTPNPSESAAAGGGTASTPSAGGTGGSSTVTSSTRQVALADNGWPQGRYWWTVVPVWVYKVPLPPSIGGSTSSSGSSGKPAANPLEYHDMALPQDLCAAGQVWPFGMQSAPLTTTSQTPFVSGLSGTRVVSAASAKASFQELPVITWKPAMSAVTYDVQLSRQLYPWSTAKSVSSVVPSAVLPLTRSEVGTWYYRVRGVNPNLIGPAQKLSWSKPAKIRISGDRFTVVK
jgi:hypothetical protein